MTETRYPGQELQDEILKTVRKSQEAVIDALRAWADTVQSIVPKLPAVSVPLADKLPKPEDVVANAYDFAEQLLASQRKFAEDMIKATAPLAPVKGNGQAARTTSSATK
jgi:plasmid maintenance system antidote protein VapI